MQDQLKSISTTESASYHLPQQELDTNITVSSKSFTDQENEETT